MKIIFTVSVLLNLTLVGFVGAHQYKKYQHHKMLDNRHGEAQDIIKKLKPSRSEMQERMKAIRQNRTDLKMIIEADEFDLEAYEITIDKILDDKNMSARVRAEKMGKTLSSLSQEDRQKISTHMLSKFSGRSKNHQKGGHKSPREMRDLR